ncbi:NADH dehydrogenase [ubiquinone] 1 alpha subcomplex assembly factor 3 [Pseudomyrmex gracilis]|uniref:NADH dehydrogenase [ubiquinone] 1 alpha subcomplex assembly factor 3 n=1 Tax=Pseudomyrmex gracilis TaxID=219809 RepID=UPI0009951664|nr:NADH dehydrogenase [ubiquinone] 1 alpha subcomplex assembly factor 3 [Pseudomyrmex gracilis]
MNATGVFCQLRQVLRIGRTVHTTCIGRASAYDGPGKTTISFVSKEVEASKIIVTGCNELGFTLNTGTKVIGPTMLFPRHAISWNIKSGKHINEASLSLLTVLEPRPDILIIGLDEKYDFAFLRHLRELVRKLDVSAEILDVHKACSVFNFLTEEGRYAIAALIPPKKTARHQPPKLPKSESVESEKQIADDAASKDGDDDTETKTKSAK